MEAGSDSFVIKTLDRKRLWEMQTPQVLYFYALSHFVFTLCFKACADLCFYMLADQVIKPELLRDGFELVYRWPHYPMHLLQFLLIVLVSRCPVLLLFFISCFVSTL